MTNYKVMICPRCTIVFEEKDVKGLKTARSSDPRKGSKGGSTYRFIFDKRGIPHRNQDFQRKSGNHQKTYVSTSNPPKREWVRHVNQRGLTQ